MWLTRFSIQRPIIVAMLFIALAIYGMFSFFSIGRSLNPNVNFPIVVVSASYPGASPSEMERLVIKPIEDQIDGIDNLDQMSATAQDGIAPSSCSSNSIPISTLPRSTCSAASIPRAFTCDRPRSADRRQERRFLASADPHAGAEFEGARGDGSLRPRRATYRADIRHVDNVQSIDTSGDVKREFHVLPDPLRLMGTGATVADIFQAINSNNANVPGGRMTAPNAETDVSVHSDIIKASDMLAIPLPIASALLANGFAPSAATGLRIGDVATADDVTSSSARSRSSTETRRWCSTSIA